MNPRVRVYVAWGMVVVTIIGWPVSMLWLAKNEPPFVLSLSWIALILGAFEVLATADVRAKQHEKEKDDE